MVRNGTFCNMRNDLANYHGDWAAQGFWVMLIYRLGRWRYSIKYALVRKFFSLLYKVLFKLVQILMGIKLPCEAVLGKNFVIDHFGGIVISGYAKFGDYCRIRNGVVVGLTKVDDPCAPIIGNNVDIGTEAKVLGRIKIGDIAVVKDVASYAMVGGVSAKVIGLTKGIK